MQPPKRNSGEVLGLTRSLWVSGASPQLSRRPSGSESGRLPWLGACPPLQPTVRGALGILRSRGGEDAGAGEEGWSGAGAGGGKGGGEPGHRAGDAAETLSMRPAPARGAGVRTAGTPARSLRGPLQPRAPREVGGDLFVSPEPLVPGPWGPGGRSAAGGAGWRRGAAASGLEGAALPRSTSRGRCDRAGQNTRGPFSPGGERETSVLREHLLLAVLGSNPGLVGRVQTPS